MRWREEYPQLSPHHIRMATRHHDKEGIKRELDILTHIITRVIERYRNPDERQLAVWRRQFPYLTSEEIREYFKNYAAEIEARQSIFVSSVFPNMGEIALERLTKDQRAEYLRAEMNRAVQTDSPRQSAEILLLTSLSRRLIRALPALALTSVSCCWCTAVITRNPQMIPAEALLPTFWYELFRALPISAVIARVIQETLSDLRSHQRR